MKQTSFQLLERRVIPSLNLEFQSYRHGPTGARHLHLAADDDNNAFMVAFPTLPEDSTGVAHILEHTTLCGSEHYPVRDPFFMMLRRSLNTFMNAFTSSDSTAYPFATRNRKDFDNLLSVYLDAVFFPRLDPLDFAQEGWRLEFVDNAEPAQGLVYKGVVYNEMKGAMSSPVAQLWHQLQAQLFPQLPYRFNSGGDPREIPQLSYAQLQNFHRRHYHPSHAVFMTYGDFPVEEHQAKIEALALRRFQPNRTPIVAGLQPPLAAPNGAQATYAVDNDEDLKRGTHIVWGWVLGESADPMAMLEAHLLAGVLLEHSASPLRHLLETTPYANAPSELCGVDDSARQLVFCCGVEGSEPEHFEALQTDILERLAQVAATGVDDETLVAALDRIEMAQRDIGGNGYPYGLQLMGRVLPAAMYQRDPAALLDIDGLLQELRARCATPGYLAGLVRSRLLDNTHRVHVVMTPDRGKRQRDRDAESERLRTLLAHLSTEEQHRLQQQAEALQARQNRSEDASVLPKLTLADVPAATPPLHAVVAQIGGRPTHSYVRGTNGIGYVQVAIELPLLSPQEVALLPLFSAYLTELGSGGDDYLATQHRRARLGQFGASVTLRTELSSLERNVGHFIITAKGLKRKSAGLVDEVLATLAAARFDEHQRLRDLLGQTRADAELSITERGHQLAMHGAARGLSRGGFINDLWDGPANITAIKMLDDEAETHPASLARLAETFAAIRVRLLAAPARVLLIGEQDTLTTVKTALAAAGRELLQAAGFAPFRLDACAPAAAAAWVTNTEVSFNAKAYATVAEGHADTPILAVLSRYLTDGFLHPAIREQGGAYGGGASYDADSGSFCFYSYRDPRLAATLLDFDRALTWLAETRDAVRLEESILGVIRSLDKPRSPAGEAMHAFYSEQQGRTAEFRESFRRRVLATTVDDLQRVAETYLVPSRGVVGVVTHAGSQAVLEDLGTTIHQL